MNTALCTVMIADDEFWVRENLKNLLNWKELSIELCEAAVDGEDALRKLESERPDILITDINMPFVSGNELIEQAKRLYPDMPVIVLSGHNDFDFVRPALLSGAIEYLLKPVNKQGLLDVLDKAMGIVAHNRVKEIEQDEIREKLSMASSLLRDSEMSSLISDEMTENSGTSGRSDLELEFVVFTLVLVKLGGFPRKAGQDREDISRQAGLVKSIMTKKGAGAKALAFQNVYARNEFILLTALDAKGIANLCNELPQKLEGYTGSGVSVAVSKPYYSFEKIRLAYNEARAALLARRAGGDDKVVFSEQSQKLAVQKRINSELENRLLFAIQSKNKQLLREVVFDQIGLRTKETANWLLVEVKQTVEYLAGMIFHHGNEDPSSRSTQAMENFSDLLSIALDSRDIPEVCALLEQLMDEVMDGAAFPGASESAKQTVRHVQKYIDEHYFEQLSLGVLSDMFHVERSYLSKVFKQVSGSNLMSAIAKKRIEKAEEYIRQKQLSLTEISYLVGYEEYAYFNRVFRKVTGMSPSDYKQGLGKEARQ